MRLLRVQFVVKVPGELPRQPELRRRVEEPAKAQGRVRRDTPPAVHEKIDALEGHPDAAGKLRLGDSLGLQEVFREKLSWMRRPAVGGEPDHAGHLRFTKVRQDLCDVQRVKSAPSGRPDAAGTGTAGGLGVT